MYMLSCSPLRIMKNSNTEWLAKTLICLNASVTILWWIFFFHSEQICQKVTDCLINGEQSFQKFIDELDTHFVSFANKWIKATRNISLFSCERQNKLLSFLLLLIYIYIKSLSNGTGNDIVTELKILMFYSVKTF